MDISEYQINIEDSVKKIKDNNYKIVAVQTPEGLRRNIWKIVDFLENQTKAKVIVLADPCFGACDIPFYELKKIGVEFIVHIGHTIIPNIKKSEIPIIFINAYITKDISNVIKKSIQYFEGKKIGVVTTAQHINKIKNVISILKNNGYISVLSDGDDRISEKGQILGCNFTAGLNIKDKVDCFLFVGSGNFHPVGLLISGKKPVIAADPISGTVKKSELDDLKDTILRQRYGAIANSKNAKRFGILVGTKIGQQRLELANEIKELLESKNKKSIIITLNHFTPEFLEAFGDIDCYISTACPRIAIDDYLTYKIPIITPIELEISLGFKKWEDYEFDQLFG